MRWLSNIRPRFVEHTAWELLLMRALFAVALYLTIPWQLEPEWAEMPKPNGIAKLIPFGWMAQSGVMAWLKIPVVLGLLLYCLGRYALLGLLPALLAIIGGGAVWASQREGASQHSVQLMAMLLLAQIGVLIFRTVKTRALLGKLDLATANWLAHFSKFTIAATYVSSALMKLKASGLGWFQNGPAMAVQTIKTNWQAHYSSAKTPVNEFLVHTAPRWMADHAVLSGLFFGTGLLLEFFAFLLLCGRRWAFAIGLGLFLMHIGIFYLTSIKFSSHLYALFIFCLNVPGLCYLWLKPQKPADG